MTTKESTYMMYIEDWNTIWPHLGTNNFKLAAGPVRPGPVKPLKTDFSTLTDLQRQILVQENQYWKDMDAKENQNRT